MEDIKSFVQQSSIQNADDIWFDKYVYIKSKLYKKYKKNNYVHVGAELYVKSVYQIWLEMLRSPNTTVVEEKNKYTIRRVGINIATIELIDNEYKYTSIPKEGLKQIMSKYVTQLL